MRCLASARQCSDVCCCGACENHSESVLYMAEEIKKAWHDSLFEQTLVNVRFQFSTTCGYRHCSIRFEEGHPPRAPTLAEAALVGICWSVCLGRSYLCWQALAQADFSEDVGASQAACAKVSGMHSAQDEEEFGLQPQLRRQPHAVCFFFTRFSSCDSRIADLSPGDSGATTNPDKDRGRPWSASLVACRILHHKPPSVRTCRRWLVGHLKARASFLF